MAVTMEHHQKTNSSEQVASHGFFSFGLFCIIIQELAIEDKHMSANAYVIPLRIVVVDTEGKESETIFGAGC